MGGLGCDVVRVEVEESLTKEQLLETFITCGTAVHTLAHDTHTTHTRHTRIVHAQHIQVSHSDSNMIFLFIFGCIHLELKL